MNKWTLRYFSLALEVASWSKDSSKVGAVCVSPDKRRLITGFNGFPKSIPDDPEKLANKELKNQLMVHAEANCIVNSTTQLVGWTMHVTKAPCLECAKLIINSGIAKVVCPSPGGSWEDNQLFGISLMTTAGIIVEFYQ